MRSMTWNHGKYSSGHLLLFVLVAICFINCGIAYRRVSRWLERDTVGHGEFTYIGLDYPIELPISPLPVVEINLQESVQYRLANDTSMHWLHLENIPLGHAFARLGDDHRLFGTTMFHQMHCLHAMSSALLDHSHPIYHRYHFEHCLNYLRQTILCEAVSSLEKGDFMALDYDYTRVGDTVQCQDWSTLFDWLEGNLFDWLKRPGAGW